MPTHEACGGIHLSRAAADACGKTWQSVYDFAGAVGASLYAADIHPAQVAGVRLSNHEYARVFAEATSEYWGFREQVEERSFFVFGQQSQALRTRRLEPGILACLSPPVAALAPTGAVKDIQAEVSLEVLE